MKRMINLSIEQINFMKQIVAYKRSAVDQFNGVFRPAKNFVYVDVWLDFEMIENAVKEGYIEANNRIKTGTMCKLTEKGFVLLEQLLDIKIYYGGRA